MSKIKTREVVKDIKVLDKTQDVGTHMKNAFVRSKESAEHTQSPEHNSPSDYATDKVSGKVKETAEHSINHLKNPHQKASENINKAKDNFQKTRQHMNEVKNSFKKPADTVRQTTD